MSVLEGISSSPSLRSDSSSLSLLSYNATPPPSRELPESSLLGPPHRLGGGAKGGLEAGLGGSARSGVRGRG